MSARLAIATVSLGALLAATVTVQAHHSFSATYDSNKPITITGKISKLGWTNPHTHIYIEAKNTKGELVTWEVETAGANALLRQGLRKEDFIGAEVVVKGFLAKDGTPSINASSMTLVDSKRQYISEQAQ